jgi:hypothetical protein
VLFDELLLRLPTYEEIVKNNLQAVKIRLEGRRVCIS